MAVVVHRLGDIEDNTVEVRVWARAQADTKGGD